MKLARLLSVALVAVFALSAIVASSASAIPKFKLPITNRGFTILSGLSILRSPLAKVVVDCEKDSGAGTILGDDELDVRVHFLNCQAFVNNLGPCTIKNPGGTAGLILTELLIGLLGLLHEPNGAAGILLEPGPSAKKIFTTFALIEPSTNCEDKPESAVEGGVAGEFEPTGKLQTLGTVKLLATASGKQKITLILTLNGIVKPKLTSFGALESSEETIDVIHFEEAVEIS
jgi:hypothetical protein